jgi:hypothetical protein
MLMSPWFAATSSRPALLGSLTVLALALGLSAARAEPPVSVPGWKFNGLVEGGKIHRPGAAFWQIAGRSSSVDAGSNLEIPSGGGLIQPGTGAVTAQSLARLKVPSAEDPGTLSQIQGRVRYYADQGGPALEVVTPELLLAASGSVFEVETSAEGTEVEVVEGGVRVTTHDRVSEVRLRPGQSARVSSTNTGRLALRKQPEGTYATIAFGGGSNDNDDAARSSGGAGTDGGDRDDGGDRGRDSASTDSGSGSGSKSSADSDGRSSGDSAGAGSGKGGGGGGDKGKDSGGGKGGGKDSGGKGNDSGGGKGGGKDSGGKGKGSGGKGGGKDSGGGKGGGKGGKGK